MFHRTNSVLHRSLFLFSGIFILGTSVGTTMAANASSVLPYPIVKKTLPNGLDVIIIETPEFKNVLSYNTLVLAGARNETEPGKTGLAHLFEHILFRHRYGGKDGAYEALMGKLGTHNNAWTWFDVTFYHPLTFTSNLTGRTLDGETLPGIVDLEASRFKALDFTEKIFKTEAGAVLGEYRRIASSPTLRLSERVLALQFPHHPYGHTTIGYYEDVLDMPNEYQAALKFYDTYYRPNNCVLVIAGDVKAEEILPLLEKAYADWQPKPVPPIRTTGEPPHKEQREHVPWDADVAPIVWVSYRTPAFKPGTKESGVMLILNELLVSESAPLFKTLRYIKQSVSALSFAEGPQGFQSFDPRLMVIHAQLYKERFKKEGKAYFDEVIRDIIKGTDDLKRFSKSPNAARRLEAIKKKFRFDLMTSLSSPANIAETFAWFYRFTRDEHVLDRLVEDVASLTPEDIDAFARRYFVPERRVILTLSYEPGSTSKATTQSK